MASDKCYQLSRSLYSISTIIPCEDVQIAANRLFQCATNIQTVEDNNQNLKNLNFK